MSKAGRGRSRQLSGQQVRLVRAGSPAVQSRTARQISAAQGGWWFSWSCLSPGVRPHNPLQDFPPCLLIWNFTSIFKMPYHNCNVLTCQCWLYMDWLWMDSLYKMIKSDWVHRVCVSVLVVKIQLLFTWVLSGRSVQGRAVPQPGHTMQNDVKCLQDTLLVTCLGTPESHPSLGRRKAGFNRWLFSTEWHFRGLSLLGTEQTQIYYGDGVGGKRRKIKAWISQGNWSTIYKPSPCTQLQILLQLFTLLNCDQVYVGFLNQGRR